MKVKIKRKEYRKVLNYGRTIGNPFPEELEFTVEEKNRIDTDCPMCKGAGAISRVVRAKRYTDKDRTLAVKLFEQGLTYRKIAEEMGIKHPQSAVWLVKSGYKRKQ